MSVAMGGDYRVVALPTLMIIDADRRLIFRSAATTRNGIVAARARLDEIHQRQQVKTKPSTETRRASGTTKWLAGSSNWDPWAGRDDSTDIRCRHGLVSEEIR